MIDLPVQILVTMTESQKSRLMAIMAKLGEKDASKCLMRIFEEYIPKKSFLVNVSYKTKRGEFWEQHTVFADTKTLAADKAKHLVFHKRPARKFCTFYAVEL